MKGDASGLNISQGTAISRALRTPVADLLRGRFVGENALSEVLSREALPAPVPGLIRRVVRTARLWPSEEVDVARELAVHFRDGFDSGKSIEEVVRDFGDVRKAAKLIRRGKLRCRPLHWRLGQRATQVLAVTLPLLLAVHTFLIIRFYGGEPRVDNSTVAALVSSVDTTMDALPEAERALPIYEAVLSELEALFERIPIAEDEYRREEWSLLGPRSPYWEQFLGLAREDSALWSSLARAAQLPTLGLRARPVYGYSDSYHRAATTILRLARCVEGHARRALRRREGQIVYDNVLTLIGMSQHLGENARLSHYLVEMSSVITMRAFDLLLETLAADLSLLSDTQLEAIAARLRTHHFRLDLRGDRINYQLLWDNHYSDDGDGDGWLTPRGMRGITVSGRRVLHARSTWLDKAVAPLFAIFCPSKKELTERGHALLDEIEAELARPLWDRRYPEGCRWRDGLESSGSRWAPVTGLLPQAIPLALDECMRQRADAVLTAIAIGRYRRQSGDWPDALDALAPTLLPEVPRDRFDGGSLRYRLGGGELLLYSVGVDRDDDGGRPTAKGSRAHDWLGAHAREGRAGEVRYDGDWILWRRRADSER